MYKSSIEFPDLNNKDFPILEGIVAVGGNIDIGTLYNAYVRGIFPWPHRDYPNLWFCPDERGIIEFSEFHVPRSLIKFRRKNPHYKMTINQNFDQVIEECSLQVRSGQDGTWISDEMKRGYKEFSREGFVVSVECWDTSKTPNLLVAGIYGVYVHGVFSGESMFHRQPNTSKLALWYLIDFLSQQGLQWIDTQMVTPLVKSFGGKYIPRKLYLQKLVSRQREWKEKFNPAT